MGELKGQILGLILVIILFGTVGLVVKEVFDGSVEEILRHIGNTFSNFEN